MKLFNSYPVILASGSPRRLELLQKIGIQPLVVRSEFEERKNEDEADIDYVMRNTRGKADWVLSSSDQINRSQTSFMITADTIVSIRDEVLEKPRDKSHAYEMLKKLSGSIHIVYTGFQVAMIKNGEMIEKKSELVSTEVEFKSLSEPEIAAYLETDEPWDKAGGYALQGIGCFLVKRISGSYTNVIGLPMMEIGETLMEMSKN